MLDGLISAIASRAARGILCSGPIGSIVQVGSSLDGVGACRDAAWLRRDSADLKMALPAFHNAEDTPH